MKMKEFQQKWNVGILQILFLDEMHKLNFLGVC